MSQTTGRLLENINSNRRAKLLAWLAPSLHQKQSATSIFSKIHRNEVAFQQEINISEYEGKNDTAIRIRSYLESRSHPAIQAALIHGSIASGEEVHYSDFDGILIIDERRLENVYSVQSLMGIMEHTHRMMLQQDALQHHGWNVLSREDLMDYPDVKLPLVLLENSKVIYPSRNILLNYTINRAIQQYSDPLQGLCRSIENKCRKKIPATSFSEFKTWVSQLLLLPALYLQNKHQSPVLKKTSFDRLNELPSGCGDIIRKFSKLRQSWSQSEADPAKEWNARLMPSILRRKLSASVPVRFNEFVSESTLNEVEQMILKIQSESRG